MNKDQLIKDFLSTGESYKYYAKKYKVKVYVIQRLISRYFIEKKIDEKAKGEIR